MTTERAESLPATDSALRSARRTAFGKELRKRIAERESLDDLTARADPATPTAIRQELSASDARIHARLDGLKPKERTPVAKPEVPPEPIPDAEEAKPAAEEEAVAPIKAGDSLAARARKMRKARESGG